MNMQDSSILVRPIRTFHGEEGFKTPSSEPFSVSRQRLAELKANALVVEAVPVEKAMPAPSNKATQPPKSKNKHVDAAD